MIYLTFNNGLSGIYRSQVIDTCNYLEEEFPVRVRLVAFISLRNYFKEKRRLREAKPDCTVLPMFPGVKNWSLNVVCLGLFCLFHGEKTLMGRSDFATVLGLKVKKAGLLRKVIFDGRSASAAEWEEYDVGGGKVFPKDRLRQIEQRAVLESDQRVAVSSRLVDYWKERYAYSGTDHQIIPCTLAKDAFEASPLPKIDRKSLGFQEDQVVLVFSGAASQWQSFELMDEFVKGRMKADLKVAFLFMSNKDHQELSVFAEYPDRCKKLWVSPEQVAGYMALGDYGILFRENTITNQVASPTKFAEYLACGLQVLITPGLGDLSSFVEKHRCGQVIENPNDYSEVLAPTSSEKREANIVLARQYFTKPVYQQQYQNLLRL